MTFLLKSVTKPTFNLEPKTNCNFWKWSGTNYSEVDLCNSHWFVVFCGNLHTVKGFIHQSIYFLTLAGGQCIYHLLYFCSSAMELSCHFGLRWCFPFSHSVSNDRLNLLLFIVRFYLCHGWYVPVFNDHSSFFYLVFLLPLFQLGKPLCVYCRLLVEGPTGEVLTTSFTSSRSDRSSRTVNYANVSLHTPFKEWFQIFIF